MLDATLPPPATLMGLGFGDGGTPASLSSDPGVGTAFQGPALRAILLT